MHLAHTKEWTAEWMAVVSQKPPDNLVIFWFIGHSLLLLLVLEQTGLRVGSLAP